ncbi:hypothetical protein B296_00050025 [Ensete ventricosum]|uniref:Uncharacterized protein n=1 Tax=Ensete ventricosum TaxID=4639 RepID=A0A426X993_ENSVE|nr:hypothetical protein B296_00050025 [Ensete ventricosum]
MESRTSTVSQKNSMVIYFARIARRVKFRSVFRALFLKFKILPILDVLAHGKSYEHGFMKTRDGHKLARSHAQSGISIGFSCSVSEIQNTGHSRRISLWKVVRAWFHK